MINRIAVPFFFSHNFSTTEDTSEVTSVASSVYTSEVTSEVYTEAIKKGNKKKSRQDCRPFLNYYPAKGEELILMQAMLLQLLPFLTILRLLFSIVVSLGSCLLEHF